MKTFALRAAFATTRVLALCAATLVGCGDDGAGTGGAPSSATSTAAGPTATSATAGSGGAGGSSGTGGGNACGELLITEGSPAACVGSAAGSLPLEDTFTCPESGDVWPGRLYALDVVAGECLHLQVDNAGSPSGADMFGALVDPGGTSLLFDDDVSCTVEGPESDLCPTGAVTVETTGRALVVVGAFAGEGCPPSTTTPFQLVVSRDGVDQDLAGAFLCEGDLLEIIP